MSLNVEARDGAWPPGPYRFDDISSRSQDDGLGYIYLDDGGCSPTLAHTGDTRLTAAENRALGHLFAAAPALYEALLELRTVGNNMAARKAARAKADAALSSAQRGRL